MPLPVRLVTPRLVLRPPCPADAPALASAVNASYAELHRWMPWARGGYGLEEAQAFCADAASEDDNPPAYPVLLELRASGRIVGASGFAAIDWTVPKCEIGYWLRTDHVGQGLAAEAVRELAKFAFEFLHCKRVEIRADARNERSRAVAERLGFEWEATLKADSRDNAGKLRDTRVYAMFDPQPLR